MDIAALKADLSGLKIEDNPKIVQQKSRDFYWYSPILKRQLEGLTADFVVSPHDEAEIIKVLAACFAHDVPLTVRGAGTGNYGQAMPLAGGCILHTKHLDKVVKVADDHLIAQTGAVMSEYPPGVLPLPHRFPARNRMVAALARGVVVVEGAPGSGSLITAEFAGDLGGDVMAVPGGVTGPLSAAPNALIRDGAALVRNAEDVLAWLREAV
jgi:hypothetical protein